MTYSKLMIAAFSVTMLAGTAEAKSFSNTSSATSQEQIQQHNNKFDPNALEPAAGTPVQNNNPNNVEPVYTDGVRNNVDTGTGTVSDGNVSITNQNTKGTIPASRTGTQDNLR